MFSNWFVCIFIFKLIVAERPRRTTTIEYFDAILKDAPTHCFDITIKANDNGNNNVSYATVNIPIPVTHSWMSEAPWKHVRKMERMNMWMNIGRDMHISPNVDHHRFHSSFELSHKQLMYIPGRTIIFDDFNKALLHVGIKNWIPLPSRHVRSRTRHRSRKPRGAPKRNSHRIATAAAPAPGGRVPSFSPTAAPSAFPSPAPTTLRNFEKAEAMALLVKKLSKNYDSVVFRQHLDSHNTCNYHCCKEGSQLVQEMVALNGWNDTQCPGHRNLSWDTGSCDCLFTRYC